MIDMLKIKTKHKVIYYRLRRTLIVSKSLLGLNSDLQFEEFEDIVQEYTHQTL